MAFDAFISYSHDSDKRWVGALRRALQRIAKPWYRRHSVKVFLDESNAVLTPRLQSYLRDRVRESKAFILLASENAAASPWVADELRTFFEQHTADSVALLLTSGTIAWDAEAHDFDWTGTTALPRVLGGRYAEEPKYLDLRWTREIAEPSSDPRMQDAAAEIVAAIQGRGKEEIVGEDLRQHRRTLRLATTAAAVLAVLLIASVAAGWYATIQQRTAERRFRDVRQLANSFLFEFYDAIDDLPGATPAQHLVVNTALTYLDQLSKEASGNVELLGELGTAYQRLGFLQGGAVAANLGDAAGAMRSFRRAVEIQKERIALGGNEPDRRSELAWTYGLLGDALQVSGDREGALDSFLQSLQIAEELASAFPANETFQVRLGTAYEKLGDVSIADSSDPAARRHYQRYLEISEQQGARSPGTYTTLHNLGLAHGKWADVLSREGEGKEAREHYVKQREFFVQLAALDQDRNTHARRDLALANIDLANIHATLEDWQEAEQYFSLAIASLEQLTRDDPRNVQFQQNLVYAHGAYATVLAKQENRVKDAEREYEAAIRPLEAIVKADAGNRHHFWNLTALYNEYSDFLQEHDRVPETLPIHRKDVAILEPLVKGLTDFRSQKELVVSYYNLAWVLDETDDAAGAAKYYTLSYELSKRMAEQFPSSGEVQTDIADSAEELARLYEDNPAKAQQFNTEAATAKARATALTPTVTRAAP